MYNFKTIYYILLLFAAKPELELCETWVLIRVEDNRIFDLRILHKPILQPIQIEHQ